MSLNSPKSIADIDFANLTKRKYTPSPDFWSDQVLYFLMLDRTVLAVARRGGGLAGRNLKGSEVEAGLLTPAGGDGDLD